MPTAYIAPTVIGLSGYARSGKDTVADRLVNTHGFTKIGFADALKEAVYVLNPCLADGRRLRTIVDEVGWEGAKKGSEVRRLLQVMGTEVARDLWDEDFWVTLAFQRITTPGGPTRWVFSDCRYPNEARMIERVGGVVWRIHRPGTEPINAHSSETGLDGRGFDDQIHNDGTIPDLYEKVDRLLEKTLHA